MKVTIHLPQAPIPPLEPPTTSTRCSHLPLAAPLDAFSALLSPFTASLLLSNRVSSSCSSSSSSILAKRTCFFLMTVEEAIPSGLWLRRRLLLVVVNRRDFAAYLLGLFDCWQKCKRTGMIATSHTARSLKLKNMYWQSARFCPFATQRYKSRLFRVTSNWRVAAEIRKQKNQITISVCTTFNIYLVIQLCMVDLSL